MEIVPELSRDFCQAMASGQLSEFDDGESAQFYDFLDWHGLVKVLLRREQTYRDLLRQQPLTVQLRNVAVPA